MPRSSPTVSVERTPDMPSNVTFSAFLISLSRLGFAKIDPFAPVSRMISSALNRTCLLAASDER